MPVTRTSPRRLAGVAGLGYVVAAAVANMRIHEAPPADPPIGEIRAS
jgi:hypothetical protein